MQGGHILPGGIQVGFPVQYCGVASEPGIPSLEVLRQPLLQPPLSGRNHLGRPSGEPESLGFSRQQEHDITGKRPVIQLDAPPLASNALET